MPSAVQWQETPILSAVAMLSNLRKSQKSLIKPSSTNPTPWRVSWEDLQGSDLFPSQTPPPTSSAVDSGHENVQGPTRRGEVDAPPATRARSPLYTSPLSRVSSSSTASPKALAMNDLARVEPWPVTQNETALPQKERETAPAADTVSHGHPSVACAKSTQNGGAIASPGLVEDAARGSATAHGEGVMVSSAFQISQASSPSASGTPALSQSGGYDKVGESALDMAATPNQDLQMSLDGWGSPITHDESGGVSGGQQQEGPRFVCQASCLQLQRSERLKLFYVCLGPCTDASIK